GQIRTTPVEWKTAPTATEGGPPAVTVAEVGEPAGRGQNVFFTGGWRKQRRQSQERPRRVVGVRHASREVRPAPTAGGGAGVRVDLGLLLLQDPRERFVVLRERVEIICGGEGVDGEGRDPDREVCVDRPTEVGA